MHSRGAAHSHRERHQRQLRSPGRIFSDQQLVTTHSGEIIDVAGFGHSDDRMNQQAGFDLFCGPEG